MRTESIYRYPVKGLGAEKLGRVQLEKGRAMPWDRAYAIAHGQTSFDQASPVYLPKRHFLMLMSQPRLAQLWPELDISNNLLKINGPNGKSVSADPDSKEGAASIDQYLDEFAGDLSLGGSPRLIFSKGHHFFDVPDQYLSLINLASIEDLAEKMRQELNILRFRANIYVSGIAAWEELDWVGRTLCCGGLRLRIAAPIERCAATNVNLQTAEFDVNIPRALFRNYQHRIMGVYVEVIQDGTLTVDDNFHLES